MELVDRARTTPERQPGAVFLFHPNTPIRIRASERTEFVPEPGWPSGLHPATFAFHSKGGYYLTPSNYLRPVMRFHAWNTHMDDDDGDARLRCCAPGEPLVTPFSYV